MSSSKGEVYSEIILMSLFFSEEKQELRYWQVWHSHLSFAFYSYRVFPYAKIFEILVKFGLYSRFIQTFFDKRANYWYFLYIFVADYHRPVFLSSRLDEFFHNGRQGSPRRAEYDLVAKMIKRYKVGIGWENIVQDILRRLLTLCLRHTEILQSLSI